MLPLLTQASTDSQHTLILIQDDKRQMSFLSFYPYALWCDDCIVFQICVQSYPVWQNRSVEHRLQIGFCRKPFEDDIISTSNSNRCRDFHGKLQLRSLLVLKVMPLRWHSFYKFHYRTCSLLEMLKDPNWLILFARVDPRICRSCKWKSRFSVCSTVR